MIRIAILADIHGNLPALEAVVRDFTRRGVDVVANLGDILSGPLLPRETACFLMTPVSSIPAASVFLATTTPPPAPGHRNRLPSAGYAIIDDMRCSLGCGWPT